MGGALVDGARVEWQIARDTADSLINEVELECDGWLFVGGSVARQDATCGDIDAVFLPLSDSGASDFDNWCERNDIKQNRKVRRGIYKEMQVDFWIADFGNITTMIQFVNGSGWFNGALRSLAKRKGMKLSQLGLYKDDKVIAGPMEPQTKEECSNGEAEIFDALSVDFIPLNKRTAENIGQAFAIIKRYAR